jgi:2-polyprenyl-3-methyl-5-hydroxy-6-metoxy-1,4-benzoquinol methylase
LRIDFDLPAGKDNPMLARRILPDEYSTWNKKWGAPWGHSSRVPGLPTMTRWAGVDYRLAAIFGPFAYQGNSSTRTYEFPWAYYAVRPMSGLRVLEIGGALSGLQFVLARAGCEVHNVDPFFDYGGGEYRSGPERRHAQLNKAFKTDVKLYKSTLPDANIEGTFDVIYSVSTLEHIPKEALEETLIFARRLLKPEGRIVLSVDLFLDLEPFGDRVTNKWGTNVAPKWIADVLKMELADGVPSELLGYEGFSAERILERLEDFAVGSHYPQLAQLMVFGTP